MLSFLNDDAEHETHAAHALDIRRAKGQDAVAQVLTLFAYFHQKLAVTDSIEHDVCCGADNRRTAEGGRVRARRQDVAAGIRRHDSADRHAAAKTLCHSDNVRLDVVLLEGKQAAGTADTSLHLVDDEQHILLAAELLYLLDELAVKRQDTALALDQLHHDGAGHIVRLCAYRLDVVGSRVIKALGKREEIVVKTLLTGGLQRGYGTAVEGVDERQHLVAALAVLVERILTSQLDGTLVCFGARVGKEYLAAQMRLFYQLLGNLNHRLGGEQVGNMHQLVRLLVDCVNDRRIGITQTVYTDAGSKIDVLLALNVPQSRTLAVVQRNREPAVGVHYIFVFFAF